MTKNKFAGLAEAKLKALDEEGSEESVEAPPKKKASKPSKKEPMKLASKKAVKQLSNKASSDEITVGVTIKIPESKRIWWNVQAKLQRTTVTEAIIEALDKRFGEPNF